jgi:hypothetical protein
VSFSALMDAHLVFLHFCWQIRRDKIAEKMNQLEALVPHHHKLDKASMLEEIIEYVKYMQLQVQVRRCILQFKV